VTTGRVRNTLSESAIKAIVSIVLNRSTIEGKSKFVSEEEIAEQAYTINVPRYMNITPSVSETDPELLSKTKITLGQKIAEVSESMEDILQRLKSNIKSELA
jgi:type I restriction-modification system DNA methylase subunit